jgi:predicted RNA-binding Zn-ribbon protein involved in translation (DUF1610 family)
MRKHEGYSTILQGFVRRYGRQRMSQRFISLICATCGASLDVCDDIERFACGYCGTSLVVQRRGGAVALRLVAQAIKQVQIGTDKTAAELALVRLRQDRSDLVAKFATAKHGADPRPGKTIGIAMFGLGAWAAVSGLGFMSVMLLFIGFVVLLVALDSGDRRSRWEQARAEFQSKAGNIDQEIARKLEIVSESYSDK